MKPFILLCFLIGAITNAWAQSKPAYFCSPLLSPEQEVKLPYLKFTVRCPLSYLSDCDPDFEECILSELNLGRKDTTHYRIQRTDSALIVSRIPLKGSPRRLIIGNVTDSGRGFFRHVMVQNADFSYSHFANDIEFIYSSFKQPVTFYRSTFYKGSQFNDNTFDQSVSFEGVYFYEQAQFSGCTFRSDLSFNRSAFGKRVTFFDAVFQRVPSFVGAELPDTLDFRNVRLDLPPEYINREIFDFRKARPRQVVTDKARKCVILLSGTDVSQFLLPYDRFQLVYQSDLNSQRVQATTREELISTYETLISSCKAAGMLESAQGWDIEYRKLQNLIRFGWSGRYINAFNEWWWNFGYDKWKILLIWLPLFFVFFWLYNYYHIERLWETMYKDTELGSNYPWLKPDFIQGNNLLSFSFFYTAVIYFGFKLRHESVNYDNSRGLVYLYLMYAVGTIHMAFAFSYILSAY